MTVLADTFNSPEAHTDGTFVFVDLFDSTARKANGEAAWVNETAYYYDIVKGVVETNGNGRIVKFLGDGVMIAYGEDGATAAVNDAIEIQQMLEDGVEGRKVNIACSIGIATGNVVRFEVVPGMDDFLGTTVDLAARLCSIASPQAIFVDTATTDSAQMNKVTSTVGVALRRTASEYKGAVQKANLKGFAEPVEYHEILWSRQPLGLKSKAVTDAIDQPRAAAGVAVAARGSHDAGGGAGRATRGQRGVVRSWNREHRRGFVEATDGTRHYTDMRFVVSDDELVVGDVVYFVALPPTSADRAPIAAAVLALGQYVEGRVTAVLDGFAFMRTTDGRGTAQDVFMSAADFEGTPERGQLLEFEVGETHRGVRAESIEAIDGGASAAA